MFMFCLMAKEQQVKPVSATRRQVRFSYPLELPASRVVHLHPQYRWCSPNKEGLSTLGKDGLGCLEKRKVDTRNGEIDLNLQSFRVRNEDIEISQTLVIKRGYAIIMCDTTAQYSSIHHAGVHYSKAFLHTCSPENQIRRFCCLRKTRTRDLRHLSDAQHRNC